MSCAASSAPAYRDAVTTGQLSTASERFLPTGVVTFLFTDIEGSTRLLRRLGDRYADVLARHHALMRACIDDHDGHEVDTEGDAFFVAFADRKSTRLNSSHANISYAV